MFLTPAQRLLHDQLLQKSEQLQDTIRRQQEELRQITQQLAQSQGPPQQTSIMAMQNPGRSRNTPHTALLLLFVAMTGMSHNTCHTALLPLFMAMTGMSHNTCHTALLLLFKAMTGTSQNTCHTAPVTQHCCCFSWA